LANNSTAQAINTTDESQSSSTVLFADAEQDRIWYEASGGAG
jgi:hypothetical protein